MVVVVGHLLCFLLSNFDCVFIVEMKILLDDSPSVAVEGIESIR